MEEYQKEFSEFLVKNNALFFKEGLKLKDGRPTPYFVNMGMFNNGESSYELGKFYAQMIVEKGFGDKIHIIFGPSYKGSAIAQATAIALFKEHGIKTSFNYDRKEAKTHGEATTKKDMFVGAKFFNDCNVYLVDDVATSMDTKVEALEKIQAYAEENEMKINIIGIGIGIDREQVNLDGKNAIRDFVDKHNIPVHAVSGIKNVIAYLTEKEINGKICVTEKNKKDFDQYIEKYGVKQ